MGLSDEFGRFSEPIDVRLLSDGRNTELLIDVTHTDPAELPSAPQGFVPDGPQGRKYGPYRHAALVPTTTA
jgi:hypothetical protein